MHALPLPHFWQVPPPQSTSVSFPFLVLSEQVGAWQMPPVQTPLAHLAMTAAAHWDRLLDTLDARVVPDRPREGAKPRPGRWGEYLLGTPNWPGRAEGPEEGRR